MQVQYVHLRNKANDGSISCKGGRTLAILETDKGIIVGEARCSDNDNYCKKSGRELSFARLQEKLTPTTSRTFVQEVYASWSAKKGKK